MNKGQTHQHRHQGAPAAACVTCGHEAPDRQFGQLRGCVTCEHCLLDARKREAGLGQEPYEMFIESLVDALDLREHETGLHSRRVASHTLLLARDFFSAPADLIEIYWGGLFPDIGKIGVPDAILLKPGALDAAERSIMQRHPEQGYRILEKIPFLSMAREIVLCHEERYDGKGYPAGLKGEAIQLSARLFAVIDTLDAMTFDRPYRKGMPFDAAKNEILKMSGSQFDPEAVAAFQRAESMLREMTSLDYPARAAA